MAQAFSGVQVGTWRQIAAMPFDKAQNSSSGKINETESQATGMSGTV